jgi:hypothetical protein
LRAILFGKPGVNQLQTERLLATEKFGFSLIVSAVSGGNAIQLLLGAKKAI